MAVKPGNSFRRLQMLQKGTSTGGYCPPSSSWVSIAEIWCICGCCILETQPKEETGAWTRASRWYIGAKLGCKSTVSLVKNVNLAPCSGWGLYLWLTPKLPKLGNSSMGKEGRKLLWGLVERCWCVWEGDLTGNTEQTEVRISHVRDHSVAGLDSLNDSSTEMTALPDVLFPLSI